MRPYYGLFAGLAVLGACLAAGLRSSGWLETVGFVSGIWAVWLVMDENVWNWPIGIVNSAAYVVVFAEDRLWGDMGINVMYVVLGVLGWYWWLRGGARGTELATSRITRAQATAAVVVVVATQQVMTYYFRRIHDPAPVLDGLTTALSLAAQFLLTRKVIENWLFWIVADVIYIPLYVQRGFHLTAVLYAVFLALAVRGYVLWLRDYRARQTPALG